MSDTLRDQLLGLGFKPAPVSRTGQAPGKAEGRSPATDKSRRPEPDRNARPARGAQSPRRAPPSQVRTKPHGGKPRTREEIDLAKAYAIRAQKEKDERIAAERQKQEDARKRREAKAKLAELLRDKALNDPDADIARHFEYGGKIKRVHVNARQLQALNAGELGVIQLDGRYLLVSATLLVEAEAIFAPAIALRVDPDAPADTDPYADPHYQVPDDLIW